MKALLLNPWTYLVALALLGASFAAGYRVRGSMCEAAAGKNAAKVEKAEDRRDENIEAIAGATASAVAGALAQNTGDTHESEARIIRVPVAGACRDVPDPILRELRAARDDANAALGVRVRSAPTSADPPDPADQP